MCSSVDGLFRAARYCAESGCGSVAYPEQASAEHLQDRKSVSGVLANVLFDLRRPLRYLPS